MTAPTAPRAILVEHDEPLRRTLTLALESLGLAVDALASGDLAIESVGEQVAAIAIVEARLPGALSGIETLEALKLQLPSLPVIVLCDPDRSGDLVGAFRAGAADVLVKPFELPELRTSLGRALVGSGDIAGLDFHARVELAKTAVGTGALDVAEAHLRGALGLDPLDAEVLNLFGVVAELRNDGARATRAYRAAFASDPRYGRARRNLERVMDQLTFIGPTEATGSSPLDGSRPRVAVPLVDPVRDLPLVRVAKLCAGATCGVAIGVLLDPPAAEEAATRFVAERAGIVRTAGRHDAGAVRAVSAYFFARDPVTAAAALAERYACDWILVGAWSPEPVRAALDSLAGRALLVAREPEVPACETVSCDLDGPRAAERLALAWNLAAGTRALLVLPDALVDGSEVASLPARALFERAKLPLPAWLDGERHVAVRRLHAGDAPIVVGTGGDAFLQLA